jgi:DNA-binding transcriptional LysR family regulator
MTPDLRQLQALLAIAQHGTLARAADTLHCSPTALSMQLTGLQQRLGVSLLRRTGRGLALTPQAELLLPAARDAVQSVQRLVQQVAVGLAPAGLGERPPEPVALGTILDPAAIRLGEFLQAVRQQGPHLLPTLRHGVSGWVRDEVAAGRLDAGFCLGEVDPQTFQVQTLAAVRYVVVAPRGWAARLHGGWPELLALPWISTPPTSVHHQLLAPLLARHGLSLPSVARVDQESSMIDLVKAGFGLSLAREAVALREADQAGLTVSRTHTLDTQLSLIAPRATATAAAVARTELLFQVASRVWLPSQG